jgi:hypothetical protein
MPAETPRDILLTEVESGRCIEVCRCGGPDDGRLLGYAIFFSGSWDAWARCGSLIRSMPLMQIVGSGLRTAQEAVNMIRQETIR